MSVPKLRFSEFQDAGEWEDVKINDIASTMTDYVANGSFQSLRENVIVQDFKSFALYVRLTDLRAGLGHSSQKYVDKASYQFLKKSALCGGELLMANIGANVGEVWQMPYVDVPATLAPNMLMVRFKSTGNSLFIFYFLDSEIGQERISKAIAGSGHPKINKTDLKQIKVFLPPVFKEQQKIADCLTSLADRITAETQKLDTLKVHKKGLMQQLFPAEDETLPKLRFPEFWDAGEWEEKRLGTLLLNHPDYGVNAPAVPYSEDLPTYLRITDISNEGYYLCDKKVSVDLEAKDENYLSDGDIVLARTGASVGKSYKYRKEDGKLVFAGFLIRIKPDSQKINSTFLFNFISTEQYWKWVSVNSARSGQPGINGNEYATLTIPIPPSEKDEDGLHEQQKIADCLSSLDDLITAQTQKIDTLKTHKKGLMQQLFPALDEVKA